MKQVQRLEGWWDSHLSPYLAVALATGEELDLVVDSGFNGEVVLPKSLITKLGLPGDGTMFSLLADGSVVETEVHIGKIVWFGQMREVRIQATDSDEGLLGTELFQGCVVELDPDAGRVLFRKKSSRARKRAK
jgi:clan AA aspartic protease